MPPGPRRRTATWPVRPAERPASAARQNGPLPASIRKSATHSSSVSTCMAGRARASARGGDRHRHATPAVRAPGPRSRLAASTVQATTQQNHAVHSVWLMKCAPRSCCDGPQHQAGGGDDGPGRRAPAVATPGAARRSRRRRRNAADAWPAGKHRPGPPSARPQCPMAQVGAGAAELGEVPGAAASARVLEHVDQGHAQQQADQPLDARAARQAPQHARRATRCPPAARRPPGMRRGASSRAGARPRSNCRARRIPGRRPSAAPEAGPGRSRPTRPAARAHPASTARWPPSVPGFHTGPMLHEFHAAESAALLT